MTENEKRRFGARIAVVYDLTLTPQARLLYVALDDEAAFRGTTFTSQATMGKRFGVTTRQISRLYRELEGVYLKTKRNRRGAATVELLWPDGNQDLTKMSDQEIKTGQKCPPNRTNLSVPSLLVIQGTFPGKAEGTEEEVKINCETCLDLGYVWGRADEVCTCKAGAAISANVLARRPKRRA